MAVAEALRYYGRARRYVMRHRLLPRARKFVRERHGLQVAALAATASIGYTAYRMYVHYHSARMVYRRSLVAAMECAKSYEEWLSAAQKLDRLDNSNREEKLLRKELDLYDKEMLQDRLQSLRALRASGNVSDIIFALRADMARNLGNMNNPKLQEHRHGVLFPEVIESYIEETSNQLRNLATSTEEDGFAPQGSDGTTISLEDKLAFLQETRHAFGRTALVLSGGGALGGFHIGVVEALLRKRLLPRILAGSSVGSLMCAVICTRTAEELDRTGMEHIMEFARNGDMRFFGVTSWRLMLRNFWRTGHLQELGTFVQMLRTLFGDLTFQEAYEKSGRILNISLCGCRRHEQPRLLNYLTAPNIVVWSAVSASCALPGLFPSQELVAKDPRGELTRLSPSRLHRLWQDGSIEQDLPLKPLSELFNVNYFIVSQANPHIAPLLSLKQGISNIGVWIPWLKESSLWTKLANLVELEYKHRITQLIELVDIRWPLTALAQTWEGDIPIVLPATLRQLQRIAANPSADELEFFKLQGLRATWSKLPALRANCLIEMTLDECVHTLKGAIRKRNRALSGKRNAYGGTSFSGASSLTHTSSMLMGGSTAPRVPSWTNLMSQVSLHRMSRHSSDSSLGELSGDLDPRFE